MEIEEAGERWVWVSFAPEYRLIVASVLGQRDQESADTLIQKTDGRIGGDLPLFVSDGLDFYANALLERYHVVVTFPRTGKPGRPRKPRKIPRPDLRYAQVVKIRRRGRVVGVVKRVVYGGENNISLEEISISLVERQNLNYRHENRRLTRKTIAFSKRDRDFECQLTIHFAYHNWIRPHRGLENEVNEHVVGKVYRKRRKRTPGMAARITNKIWTFEDLLKTKPYEISTD